MHTKITTKTTAIKVNNVFTVLLLSVRSVEWAHQSMTADVHYELADQDLSLYALSFAIWHVDFETIPKQNKIKKIDLNNAFD